LQGIALQKRFRRIGGTRGAMDREKLILKPGEKNDNKKS
jgi:hypothetical protein